MNFCVCVSLNLDLNSLGIVYRVSFAIEEQLVCYLIFMHLAVLLLLCDLQRACSWSFKLLLLCVKSVDAISLCHVCLCPSAIMSESVSTVPVVSASKRVIFKLLLV